MKTKNIITASALCSLLLTSCGNSENTSQTETSDTTVETIDYSKVEIIPHEMNEIFPTFDRLIEDSEIIMIGEVMDDGVADVVFEDPVNKTAPIETNTLHTLKVIKVFKGAELIEGDTVEEYENYAFVTYGDGHTQLSLVTNHAPLFKGDKAIFLLSYNNSMKRYIPVGTYGRFPLPEDRGKKDRFGFVDGLITGVSLNEEYYQKLLEMYNIT